MNNWGSPSLIENICDHVFQNKTKIDKKTNSFYMWHSLCKLLTSFSRSQSKGAWQISTQLSECQNIAVFCHKTFIAKSL